MGLESGGSASVQLVRDIVGQGCLLQEGGIFLRDVH